jgi:antitoxin component YwqK of YwqJK toxin-antitoxin module
MPIYKKALKYAIFPQKKGVDYLKIILLLLIISGMIFKLFSLTVISTVLLVTYICYCIKTEYKRNINDENYLPDGTHIVYIQNVSPKVIVNLKNGKRDGVCTQYFKDAIHIQFQDEYSNGKYNGFRKEFYDNGQIKVQSTWKNGIQEGKAYYYNNDGLLIRELEIVNGDYYKDCIEYNKNGKIKFINNGNKFIFFKWNINFTKKLKVCEIEYDLKKAEFLGTWTSYNAIGEIDYELDFNNAIIIEKKYNQEWYKIGYKVKKTIYNSEGEEDASVYVNISKYYANDHLLNDQIDSKLSWYRFNDIEFFRSSGFKGPPGLYNGSYIKIKPVSCLDDIIKLLEETDLKENDYNIRLVPVNHQQKGD